jgi:flagellar basal-body rod modification protein FlgD
MELIGAVTPLAQIAAQPQATPAAAGGASSAGAGAAAAAGGSPAPAASTSETGGLLQPNEFLTLLVDSLKYQDPLDPTSTSDFLTQLAELSQVQTQQEISSTGQMSSATALIGQTVGGSDLAGNPLSGVVTGVALTSSGPVLQVGSDSMELSALTSVGATPTGSAGATGSGAAAGPSATGASAGPAVPAGSASSAGTPSSAPSPLTG